MGRSHLNEVRRNFLGLLLNVLIGLRQRRWLRKGVANLPTGGSCDGPIGGGTRGESKKKQFIYSGRRERDTSHCCLPRSRLSGKTNVPGSLFFSADASCFIYIVAASSERRISCKKSGTSLFGKRTNCIFVLWKGSLSAYQPILSRSYGWRNACLR